jgi:hypothetical protein
MCVKSSGGANITRGLGGSISNASPAAELNVQCDIVNEIDLTVAGHSRIMGGILSTTDRHPDRAVTCSLLQFSRTFEGSQVFFRSTSRRTDGVSHNLFFLFFGGPDPLGETGLRSNNFYFWNIPPKTNIGASELHQYSVVEETLNPSLPVSTETGGVFQGE